MKKTTELKIREYCQEIVERRKLWKNINEQGCNDPFWPDGCNMNLLRNHILYYRKKIEEDCRETGQALPGEYFLPVPPIVDKNYMANLEQKERVDRLRRLGKLTTRKKNFDDNQLAFL